MPDDTSFEVDRSSSAPDGPKVAVIAIHGVGTHLSGASAEDVSTILTSIGRAPLGEGHEPPAEPKPAYSHFAVKSIEIPLRPVQSPKEEAKQANNTFRESWIARLWGMFDERRGFLAAERKGRKFLEQPPERNLRDGEPDRGDFGYQFMITQLAGYEGEPDRSFETVRLEGTRAPHSPAATVHIYDAHYSDLSKPQSSVVAFFFAFYQLLFHLASLSLLAVYWAEAENVAYAEAKKDWTTQFSWKLFASVHATAVRLLIMWIPLLNLVLLGIVVTAFADKLGRYTVAAAIVSVTFAAIVGLVGTFIVIRVLPSPPRPFVWALVPFGGSALGALALYGVASLYGRNSPGIWENLLIVSWLIAWGGALGYVAWKFNSMRPGAFWLGIALYSLNVFILLCLLLPHAGSNQAATAALRGLQLIFGELLLCWVVCLAAAFVAWPVSAFCKLRIEGRERKARAAAAIRTGRFAFTVPAALFLTVTSVFWSAIVVYGSDQLNAFDSIPHNDAAKTPCPVVWPRHSVPVPDVERLNLWVARSDLQGSKNERDVAASEFDNPDKGCTLPTDNPWKYYLRGLLVIGVTPGLPITAGLLVLGFLLLAWAVLPSVVYEIKPLWVEKACSCRMRSLGNWLSRGLDNTAILTRLFWFGIVVVPLVFGGLLWATWNLKVPGWLPSFMVSATGITLRFIEWPGLVIAASGAAIFSGLLKYGTTVLDAILDVDNYLRTSPQDSTPRAKIAERYTSLLRYIGNYKDDEGRPYYSKLIIVAHSLGSMVTTDLLRYLERAAYDAHDKELERFGFGNKSQMSLPIHLFSMGCPLRQLLNRFFPHLYWWVSDEPENSLGPLASATAIPAPIGEHSLPRADEMRTAGWCNAYRSGDYIGRSLWVGEWLTRNIMGKTGPNPQVSSDLHNSREEMCIGLGAHTHYWDRTAPDVAWMLNKMI